MQYTTGLLIKYDEFSKDALGEILLIIRNKIVCGYIHNIVDATIK